MKTKNKTFLTLLLLLLCSGLQARVFFLGKVIEVNPEIDIVVVEGEPAENVSIGQSYDVVLGEEIYAKIKATYVSEDGFEGRVIEGSSQELYEILKGEGEAVSDFNGFVVIEVEEAQDAVLIFKSGNVRKVKVIDQIKDGFKVKDEAGATLNIAAADLRTIYYAEEPRYRDFVKSETLVADVVPGEREREAARIAAIKVTRNFKQAIRLATGFVSSGQFDKALAQADIAIKLKPQEYIGYLIKGRALAGVGKHTFAIAMYENALKKGGKTRERPEIEYQMALTYQKMGKLKEAKKYIEAAVDHGKDDYDTVLVLTDIELKAGRFNQALSSTLWALKNKKGPRKAKGRLHHRAAQIYLDKQDNLPKARQQINLALAISPKDRGYLATRNKILLGMSKKVEKETIDVGTIGGAWRTSDDQLYVTFFEETITIFLYKIDPLSQKLVLIIIGGDTSVAQDEELIIIENAKTQKFAGVSGKALKYSQIKQVSDNFFSGEEEVDELDQEIAFKVKDYSPLKMTILLDGKTFVMVPMDTEE